MELKKKFLRCNMNLIFRIYIILVFEKRFIENGMWYVCWYYEFVYFIFERELYDNNL